MPHAARRGPRRKTRGRSPGPGEEAVNPRTPLRRRGVMILVLLFLLPPGSILAGHPLAVRLLSLGAVVHEEDDGGGEAEDDEALEDALVAVVVGAVAAHRLPVAARHSTARAAIVLVVVVVRAVIVLVVRVLM